MKANAVFQGTQDRLRSPFAQDPFVTPSKDAEAVQLSNLRANTEIVSWGLGNNLQLNDQLKTNPMAKANWDPYNTSSILERAQWNLRYDGTLGVLIDFES